MNTIKYKLEGLDCEHCAGKLAKKLNDMEGILEAEVTYPECICTLKTEKTEEEIEDAVFALIKEEEPDVVPVDLHEEGEEHHHHHDHDECGCHHHEEGEEHHHHHDHDECGCHHHEEGEEHHHHHHHHDHDEKAVYYFAVTGFEKDEAEALQKQIAALDEIESASFDVEEGRLEYVCEHSHGKEMAEKVTALVKEQKPQASVEAKGHAHVHDDDDEEEHHHEETHHTVSERTKRFSITGIDCADCAAKLERSFAKIEGIENVSLSFINSSLMYECDEADSGRIEEEIRKIAAKEEPDTVITALSTGRTLTFSIKNIDCADCAAKLARKAEKIGGVISADANFIKETLTVAYENTGKAEIVHAVTEMINDEEPEVDVRVIDKKTAAEAEDEEDNDEQKMLIRLVGGAVLFIASLLFKGSPRILLALASWLVLGYDVLIKAVRGIGRGQVFDENFLMAVATIAAIYLKDYDEAAGVMLFYQIGEFFQDMAVRRSRTSISELMDIRSEYAVVLRNGEYKKVDPEDVMVGETIRVVAGEKVPLDGVVTEGASSLDTASLTGESKPRDVDVNDEVISGSLNMSGTLLIKVTTPYSDSTVARILELVENADSRKSEQEKFITKFSRWYTPTVVFAAIITAVIVSIVTKDVNEGIYRACTFLVISCPCALVISIPLSFFAGIGGLSARGVLVKGANLIEDISSLKQIVMDKTGTLTSGKFAVTEILDTDTPDAVLKDAAYAEHLSNHPIAEGIRTACKEEIDETEIKDAKEIAGRGLSVTVKGDPIIAGNEKLMKENGIVYPDHNKAGTVVYVAKNGVYEGCLVLQDQLKESAEETVKQLQAAGRNCYMVSGDSKEIVEETSRKLGLKGAYGECLPKDKVDIVENLKKEGKTAFVGDGVNDAPVLTAADIGMAMGALGSDAAIEAADVVLMDDDPAKIVLAIDSAGRIMRVAKENIYGAITVKILTLILGAFGIANMWMAIFADTGVAMLCVLNSMRLLHISDRK